MDKYEIAITICWAVLIVGVLVILGVAFYG